MGADRFEERISVHIPRWMKEWLERRAKEDGETVSVIVRRAIREYIRKHGDGEL